MQIINAKTVDMFLMHGALCADIAHAIRFAVATGMNTIMSTPAGYFVTGGRP
jgi:hypothetical protein